MAIAAHNEDANIALVGHTYALNSCILSNFYRINPVDPIQGVFVAYNVFMWGLQLSN